MSGSSNKNLPPTRKKRERAREEGDIAKSAGITGCCVIIGAGLGVYLECFLLQRLIITEILKPFMHVLTHAEHIHINNMVIGGEEVMRIAGQLLSIPLLLAVLGGVIAEVSQVGWVWSFKTLSPRASRISFFQGLIRLLGGDAASGAFLMRPLQNGLRVTAYFAGTLAACIGVICALLRQLLWSGNLMENALSQGWTVVTMTLALVMLTIIPVAAIDLAIERRRRLKRLQMNVEELKRELKESEGNIEQKIMRRQLHQEILAQANVDGVRRARVLVIGSKDIK